MIAKRALAGCLAVACSALAAACGAPAKPAGTAPSSTGAGACVPGQAGTATAVNVPEEPASGVQTIAGACWAKIAGTPITMSVIRTAPSGTSSEFKTAWSGGNLYVWCHVHTGRTSLINSNTGSPWEDDTVEIYLGPNDQGGAYAQGDGQILVNSGGLTDTTFGGDHSDLPTTGARELEAQTKMGYTVLLIMPIANMGVPAKKGTVLGFTIGVDFPNAAASQRVGQTMWAGTNTNWNNDSTWGTATLM